MKKVILESNNELVVNSEDIIDVLYIPYSDLLLLVEIYDDDKKEYVRTWFKSPCIIPDPYIELILDHVNSTTYIDVTSDYAGNLRESYKRKAIKTNKGLFLIKEVKDW